MRLEAEVKLAELEQRSKSNSHRIDRLEERQDDLDGMLNSIVSLANEQEHIKSDVREIKQDVKEMKERPGKRWEAMADKAIWLLLGGLLSFALAGLGI